MTHFVIHSDGELRVVDPILRQWTYCWGCGLIALFSVDTRLFLGWSFGPLCDACGGGLLR